MYEFFRDLLDRLRFSVQKQRWRKKRESNGGKKRENNGGEKCQNNGGEKNQKVSGCFGVGISLGLQLRWWGCLGAEAGWGWRKRKQKTGKKYQPQASIR